MMKTSKRYSTIFLGSLCFLLILTAAVVWLVDPYYIFHKPWFALRPYYMDDYYQAEGKIRNFDYDGLIIGTSMIQQIKPSSADKVFLGKTVKILKSGAYSSDIKNAFEQAKATNRAKYVLLGLDTNILGKPSAGSRMGDLNDYAFTPNIFNISEYVFNKAILLQKLPQMLTANFNGKVQDPNKVYISSLSHYSVEQAIQNYTVPSPASIEEEAELYKENCKVIEDAVSAYDNTDLYIFIPPYSVLYWNQKRIEGTLDLVLQTQKELYLRLLQNDNVKIYYSMMDFGTITDLNNYRDAGHYSTTVCEKILSDIEADRYRLTVDNINEAFKKMKEWLDAYDWDALEQLIVLNSSPNAEKSEGGEE